MKKIVFLILSCTLFNIVPSLAQDSNLVENVIQDFNLGELGTRFAINIIAVFILVRFIYFKRHKNRDFLFTLILFNCVNFLICYLLSGANLEVGFAFGLFAIFSIMRYRTVTVPVREMGYLFICVAMGLINSLATTQDNFFILISANAFILMLPLFLDRSNTKVSGSIHPAFTQDIIYERIDLIKPEMRNEMLEDLQRRTGLPIHKVDIISIDLMQDVAVVKAHYQDKESEKTFEMVAAGSKEFGNKLRAAAIQL